MPRSKRIPPLKHLSERQRQVLLMAANGLTDKQISARLGITAGTVRCHWERIREKYGRSNRTQIISLVLNDIYKLQFRSSGAKEIKASDVMISAPARLPGLGFWELDVETGEMNSSPECRANFGLKPEQHLDLEVALQLIHPLDRTAIMTALDHCVENHAPYHALHRVNWPDGNTHNILSRGYPFAGLDGRLTRVIGITMLVD